ncbi:MAG: Hint domain-containing protein [Acidisphaera sp.]|nr:Hint domain-containing protein [Acidisphaera sp.]
MPGVTYAGTYNAGLTLTNPTTQNPATLTGLVTIANGTSAANGTGILGAGTYPWTIHVLGTVASTGPVGVGVELAVGGVLTDGASGSAAGLISATTLGVYAPVAAAVSNYGSIESAGKAIFLKGGGSVLNGQGGALISGGFLGVSIYSGPGSVTNFGSIAGGQTAGLGVEIYAGTVTNAAGAAITGAYGVGAVGGLASVINAGTIAGGLRDGVELLEGGSVANSVAASITGSYSGVLVLGAAGSVANAGSISGDKVGVQLVAGGSIGNGAGGTIAGGYGALLYDGPLSGTPTLSGAMSNLGTVSGTTHGVVLLADAMLTNGTVGSSGAVISGATYGVFVESVAATIANYGLIQGIVGVYGRDVTANNTIYAPSITLTNAGTIAGSGGTAVSLFASNDLLVVKPGASFIGAAQGGGGRLELAVGTGTLSGLGSAFSDFATTTVDPGATWTLSGTVATHTSLVNDGTIRVGGGTTLQVDTPLAAGTGDAGAVVIAGGAEAILQGAALSDELVEFTAASGELAIGNALDFAAGISGFVSGETIELIDAPLSGLTFGYSGNSTGGTLTVKENGASYAALTLNGGYTAASFHTMADPGGGTDFLTTALPCFLAGSRILTARGEVPVEALRAEDTAITAAGVPTPIAWIGRRRLDCRRHRQPERVLPIRIRAHAFGEGRPHRDLLLSPDHAVAAEGVLIPVQQLLNGISITREDRGEVIYFHVELARHDLLVAEGLAVESYLDTGNRAQFTDALHPDLASPRNADGCAPLVLAGRAVDRTRRRLVARAAVERQARALPQARRGQRA